MTETPRLELIGITKAYPGVIANNNVSLKIMPGEIHALLGENGAGKSTLVKFIYGVQKADAGRVLWEGEQVQIASPNAARKLGIGMVFQHFSLFEAMTVEENIALGISPELTKGDLSARIREVSQQYGLPLDPDRYVHTLSVGERQRIEVVRCLLQDPRLLIMDEPTSDPVYFPQAGRDQIAVPHGDDHAHGRGRGGMHAGKRNRAVHGGNDDGGGSCQSRTRFPDD